jgi:hypothetical protein
MTPPTTARRTAPITARRRGHGLDSRSPPWLRMSSIAAPKSTLICRTTIRRAGGAPLRGSLDGAIGYPGHSRLPRGITADGQTRTAILLQPADYAKSQLTGPASSSEAVQAGDGVGVSAEGAGQSITEV